jgi:hypothetical protein
MNRAVGQSRRGHEAIKRNLYKACKVVLRAVVPSSWIVACLVVVCVLLWLLMLLFVVCFVCWFCVCVWA